jgi:cytochrome c oxidase subunit 4
MAETHLTHEQEMAVESHAPTYLKVWAALAVFTAIEYFWAHVFKDTFATLILGLLFWAVIKASLVGWYFMHLKFEGNWVYGMLVPAAILATVFIVALIPDIGLQAIADESPAEEEFSMSAPLAPGPAVRAVG